MTGKTTFAQGQLRALVERIERLEEEKKAISADVREVYAEAKANGFDTKVLRKIIALRKIDANERQELEAMLDVYLAALGMSQPSYLDETESTKPSVAPHPAVGSGGELDAGTMPAPVAAPIQEQAPGDFPKGDCKPLTDETEDAESGAAFDRAAKSSDLANPQATIAPRSPLAEQVEGDSPLSSPSTDFHASPDYAGLPPGLPPPLPPPDIGDIPAFMDRRPQQGREAQ